MSPLSRMFSGAVLASGLAFPSAAQEAERTAVIAGIAPPPAVSVIEQSNAAQCHTHDGYGPNTMAMSSDGLYQTFGVRFGMAQYSDTAGYQTFIDARSLEGASSMLKEFIVEHECGHHDLGHSYEAYDYGYIPPERHARYERQADCFALRRLFEKHGFRGAENITALMDELQAVNQNIMFGLDIEEDERADMLNALPARSEARLENALQCGFN